MSNLRQRLERLEAAQTRPQAGYTLADVITSIDHPERVALGTQWQPIPAEPGSLADILRNLGARNVHQGAH